MDDIKQFFFEKNTVKTISGIEKDSTYEYIETVKALSRLTHESLYIIDYYKKEFEYVSENPLFLCNHTPQEVLDMGYAFYFQHVTESDLKLLITINKLGFEFYETLPLEERKFCTISYDFHIVNENRNAILVNHKLTPLFLTPCGKIWKAMCIVSLSRNSNAGNISIYNQITDVFWIFDIVENKWIIKEKIELSNRESEILKFVAQGLTIDEIAKKIFVTAATVKFHRRNIFDKLEVNNIREALSHALNYKLL